MYDWCVLNDLSKFHKEEEKKIDKISYSAIIFMYHANMPNVIFKSWKFHRLRSSARNNVNYY